MYYYDFCNLNIKLDIPFNVKVLPSSAPFWKESKEEQKADAIYEFISVDKLPQTCDFGHEENNRRYEEDSDEYRVFFRPEPKAAPYSCVRWKPGGSTYKCEILKGNEYRLMFSSTICDTIGIESLLLRNKGLLLHASFVSINDEGILFSAASGGGKSTQADLWVEYTDAELINGDRVGLRKSGDSWRGYGLPFAGSSLIYKNISKHIKAIIILEKSDSNFLERISPAKAVSKLYPEIMIHSWDKDYVEKATDLLIELCDQIPIYILKCLPNEDAVRLVYNTLDFKNE